MEMGAFELAANFSTTSPMNKTFFFAVTNRKDKESAMEGSLERIVAGIEEFLVINSIVFSLSFSLI